MSQKNNQLTASLLPLSRDSPGCLGAQLLPTWIILFIVNPDPCKSHFPVFLPPQSLLPSIRAGLPMLVQLSECHLVNFSVLSALVCFLSSDDCSVPGGGDRHRLTALAGHMWPIFYGCACVPCLAELCAVLPHLALPETLHRLTGRSLIQNFIFLSAQV